MSALDRFVRRTANPVMRRVLRSPVYDLFGDRVALLSVRGRRTGAIRTVPVQVHPILGGRLEARTLRRRQWWRNVRADGGVVVRWDGRDRTGRATVFDNGHPAWLRVQIDLDPPDRDAPPLVHGRALFRRFLRAAAIAELAGLAVAAIVGALVIGAPGAVWTLGLLAAGTLQGAALGLGQAVALRAALPGVRTRAWMRATAAGGLLSWGIALLIAPVVSVSGTRVGAAMGGLLVLSLGSCQWLVLRRYLPRAWRWIPATALAWGAGVLLALPVLTLWAGGQSALVIVLIGLAGGAIAAIVTSALLGLELMRLVGHVEWPHREVLRTARGRLRPAHRRPAARSRAGSRRSAPGGGGAAGRPGRSPGAGSGAPR